MIALRFGLGMWKGLVLPIGFSESYDQRGVVIGVICLDIYSTQSDGHALKNDEYVKGSSLFFEFLYLLVSKRHFSNSQP